MSRPAVTVAGDDPLVGGQVVGAHRPAGVEFVGADADLGAQAVLAAVGEAGAGVDDDRGAVDAGGEALDGAGVGAEDRVGVMRTVVVDVVDGGVDRVDDFDADDVGEVLLVPVLVGGGDGGG